MWRDCFIFVYSALAGIGNFLLCITPKVVDNPLLKLENKQCFIVFDCMSAFLYEKCSAASLLQYCPEHVSWQCL